MERNTESWDLEIAHGDPWEVAGVVPVASRHEVVEDRRSPVLVGGAQKVVQDGKLQHQVQDEQQFDEQVCHCHVGSDQPRRPSKTFFLTFV